MIGRPITAAAVTCAIALGCATTTSSGATPFTDVSPERTSATRGTLFIVGGGTQSDQLVKRFVDLAGGPAKARIAILPMATSAAAEAGAQKDAQLDSLLVAISRFSRRPSAGRRRLEQFTRATMPARLSVEHRRARQ